MSFVKPLESMRRSTSKYKRSSSNAGVFGLWERPYTTMDPKFEAGIVRVFGRLMEAGLIYRGLRPTLWSPTSRTALADTEIVYMDHVEQSDLRRLPAPRRSRGRAERDQRSRGGHLDHHPLDDPEQSGAPFHPNFQYSVVKVGERHFVVATDLVERVGVALEWGPGGPSRSRWRRLRERRLLPPDLQGLARRPRQLRHRRRRHRHRSHRPSHGRDDYYTGLGTTFPSRTPWTSEAC